eukprot:CAMPEP_0198344918 /NCGR_PEP_ID=MMETSP1450-20131203/70660_1 /TAXON_ID=753684 ORGANISM="Madagascaria erythrocladiodes, Strain CCMP3234" /NCGR_SAMPLE_ID=MMETSP1450 /ASSEMBLY_ACC=CAM_ASM_001115 /LENGTH=60 /DNA_ID=CAMNT_0044050225 /DNA_START=23 /DNA_END=201 /DNA_ORIENTATION=-
MPDHDFIVDELPHVHGFLNAAGIASPGLTSSPAIALRIVELLERCVRRERAAGDQHVVPL